jgi:hypothetical protein
LTSAKRQPVSAWFGVGCLVLYPALLLADGAIARLRGWASGSRLETTLEFGCMVAIGLVVAAVAIPSVRRTLRRRNMAMRLAAVILATACGLGLLEYSLQFFVRSHHSMLVHRWAPNFQGQFEPSPKRMPGIRGPTRFTTNGQGVRGPEMPPRPEAIRILCIGGSTTECLYLDDAKSWPYLVMARLNEQGSTRRVWVGNIGRSGASTIEHGQFARRSELMNEIDWLIVFSGVNDYLRYVNGTLDLAQRAPLWARSATWESMVAAWQAYRWRTGKPDITFEDREGSVYDLRRAAR